MLTSYKKEEDMNFKIKFENLMEVEAQRAKIKEKISLYKFRTIEDSIAKNRRNLMK